MKSNKYKKNKPNMDEQTYSINEIASDSDGEPQATKKGPPKTPKVPPKKQNKKRKRVAKPKESNKRAKKVSVEPNDSGALTNILKECVFYMGVESPVDLVEKIRKVQKKASKAGVMVGRLSLDMSPYIEKGAEGFIKYLSLSEQRGMAFVPLAFHSAYKNDVRDMTESIFYRITNNAKPLTIEKVIGRTRFWYFAIVNMRRCKVETWTWELVEQKLKAIWNNPVTDQYKCITVWNKQGRSTQGYSSKVSIFHHSGMFSQCVWNTVMEHFIKGGATGTQNTSDDSGKYILIDGL